MTSLEAQQYIDSFINHELFLNQAQSRLFKLDRVMALLSLIGCPHERLKVIHVAGSKGKGSTCALTATILQKAGYRVGLYTSPHINNYKERIRILDHSISRIDGSPSEIFPDAIREEELCLALEEIKPAIEKIRCQKELGNLSFFEVFTVLALYYFHKKRVDFAVLETGLGGRLDATNVVSSLVCAITPISLEHMHLLGNTVAAIAREKAGIIKEGCPRVVVAVQEKEAERVIQERCQEFSIKPVMVGQDIRYESIAQGMEKQTFHINTQKKRYRYLQLGLLGRHQIVNAAVALGIIECLQEMGFPIPRRAITEGLRQTHWPLRFELIRRRPLIILDGAHNQASIQALVLTLREVLPDRRVTLIFGLSKDKERKAICRELTPVVHEIIVTKSNHPRAADFSESELGELFSNIPYVCTATVAQAVELAFQRTAKGDQKREDVIVITGSIFLASEARQHLLSSRKLEQCIS